MFKHKRYFLISLIAFISFAVWTILVCCVDVGISGPKDTAVGFSSLNTWVHELTGVNFTLYTITDWLGLVPAAVCLVYAVLGLVQWIRRGKINRVDGDLILLGVFYILTIAAYLLFEYCVINYRPILINGRLESSYPSSTTLLVLCVMPTAMIQAGMRVRNKVFRRCIIGIFAVFCVFMVLGRVMSGVHWISDIIGGILLSTGLVILYYALILHVKRTYD